MSSAQFASVAGDAFRIETVIYDCSFTLGLFSLKGQFTQNIKIKTIAHFHSWDQTMKTRLVW